MSDTDSVTATTKHVSPPSSTNGSHEKKNEDLVAEFVKASGGHTVITKVLIANNGIAAVKEIRSVRKWAYEQFGDERAIEFTVMATPEDLRVNAEYIRMADQYVEVPGGSNNNNYANVDLIVDVAERTGVHVSRTIFNHMAGWGHASENPRLPESLAATERGIVFIGPPGSAMRSLGDKISSTIVAQSAQVPTLSWSGDNITGIVRDEYQHVSVPDDVYQQALIASESQGLESGGGKGIRRVDREEQFHAAYEQVLAEVPGSPIFIMKLASAARHLEHGNAISLFGRDCSVQRQAPVTIAPDNLFEKMEQAAIRLAKLVGYYLYAPETNQYYFLELNPRLQVEHPTTEMVSGVNLPAAQLQVAMGIPLHRIRDIRLLYGVAPQGSSEIDFEGDSQQAVNNQRRPTPRGHVIAVRITAENPDAGFKPSSGMVHELNFRSSTNVWGYFSVAGGGGGLHEFADSQFGHIFAYGENRVQSRKNMIVALRQLSIRSDFRTTVEYLIRLLETEDFSMNRIDTGWLDSLILKQLTPDRPDPILSVLCGAVHRAHSAFSDRRVEFRHALERGQQPSADLLRTEFTDDIILAGIKYRFIASASSPDTYIIYINGRGVEIGVRPLSDGGMLVLVNGRSHTMYWREEVQATRVMIDGRTCMLERESDPTQLRSPSPVAQGEHLRAGDAYAEVEVMKMYMPLTVTEDGAVQLIRPAGSTLAPGDVIGILSLTDPSRVKHAQPFDGQLPVMGPASVHGDKPHQKLREAQRPMPFLEFSQLMSTLHGRLPGQLEATLLSLVEHVAHGSISSGTSTPNGPSSRVVSPLSIDTFPATKLRHAIDEARKQWSSYSPETIAAMNATVAPILECINRFSRGIHGFQESVMIQLLEKYYTAEQLFDEADKRDEEVILSLREQFKEDLDHVVALVFSHSRISSKNQLMLALFDLIMPDRDNGVLAEAYQPIFKQLANLNGIRSAKIAIRAREMLILGQLPSFEERQQQMEQILRQSVTDNIYGANAEYRTPQLEVMKDLVMTNFYVFDVLGPFFFHSVPWIRLAALEVYSRRAYHAYDVGEVSYHTDANKPFAFLWEFWRKNYLDESTASAESGSANARRVDSETDLSSLVGPTSPTALTRRGLMVSFLSFDEIAGQMSTVLDYLPLKPADSSVAMNIVNITAPLPLVIERCRAILQASAADLRAHGVRRVTFVLVGGREQSGVYTFRDNEDFAEDQTIRHLDPGLAYQLELRRLSNFELTPCFLDNRRLHIYYAVGRENTSDCRFFIRALVRPGRVRSSQQTTDYLISESDRLINDILDAFEVVSGARPNSDCNHLFISFIPTFVLGADEVETALTNFIERHGKRLWRLHVTGGEIRFIVQTSPNGPAIPIRFCISTVSGYVIKVDIYMEKRKLDGTWIFSSLNSRHHQPELQQHDQQRQQQQQPNPINAPYRTKEWLQPKRYKAHVMGTTYVYDFPELFQQEIRHQWDKVIKQDKSIKMPRELINVQELILNEHGQLEQICRPPGTNSCGMVTWLFTMFTPEYPEGRDAVVIANDITFQSGSFAVEEDRVFSKATELARQRGLPRIYLSANSGARIGLADEVLAKIQVAWSNPQDPAEGFDYLYLTEEDYQQLMQKGSDASSPPVIAERIALSGDIEGEVEDRVRYQSKGSGQIAGDTSRAYEDIFTISLVTCRSVGIGAYLVRLGQRVIQNQGQPILLTGASALNKVLGREVYASNLQLGGTQIMHKNGVAHLVAEHDLHGINRIMRWLSYVPRQRDAPLPIWLYNFDPVDRDIEVEPSTTPYDPRLLLAEQHWLGGFFDRDSFMETLVGWARSVVVGRARLGGIPVGVISVESRTGERIIPADPANANSEEQVQASRTAQAIRDFNNGEQLPLIIFANWRGFSGGQRDILSPPIFVYIIPNGELRGGAWVVLDPTINPDYMEMYADEASRAGILEPEGIVDRLDTPFREHKRQLDDLTLSTAQRAEAKELLDARERELAPVYRQVALQFADLHDTPGRMLAKGVIRKVLKWQNARRYFYWQRAYTQLRSADGDLSRAQAVKMLQKTIDTHTMILSGQAAIEHCQASVRSNCIRHQTAMLVQENHVAAMQGLAQAIKAMSQSDQQALLAELGLPRP
ncbi:acetyl-CoA carboxylase [Syncephalis fuscata]|nr:acetyl-CoA carboxylase [Syncephalis fuscata]